MERRGGNGAEGNIDGAERRYSAQGQTVPNRNIRRAEARNYSDGPHDSLQLPGNWLGYVSIPGIDWWAEVPEYCCRERSIRPLAFRYALFARDARNALRAHATASIKLVNDYKSYQRV